MKKHDNVKYTCTDNKLLCFAKSITLWYSLTWPKYCKREEMSGETVIEFE